MPILYAAELALGEEDVRPFLDWYAYRHVPDLFACGFSVCTCYRAIEGDMTFLDLYELPGRDVLAQPGYTRLGSRDGYAAAVLDRRIDKSNTLYLQRAVAPAGFGDGPTLDADWISAVRFDAPAESAARIEEALRGEAAHLIDRGALRIRLAERTQDHPVYTTHRPRWITLAEWARRPPDEASLTAVLGRSAAPGITAVKPFTGYRAYPWPDDRSLLR